MKTIEERAILNLQYEKDFLGRNLSDNMVCRAYVRGAEEQKAIDDAKLLKLKSSWEKEAQINHDAEMHYKQGYHDAIEKAYKWIKANTEGGVHPQNAYGFPMQIVNVGEDYAYASFEGNEGDPWEFDDKDDQPRPILLSGTVLIDNGWDAHSYTSPHNLKIYYYVKDESENHLIWNSEVLSIWFDYDKKGKIA